jgi:RNA polymerase sigma-70 factor (sigma-E family)
MADDDFRTFVEARYANLLRTAYLLTGDASSAEDLVQTALLATMQRWRRMNQPEAYVRQVMVNHLISRWRRPRVLEILTDQVPDHASRTGDWTGEFDSAHPADEVWQALRRLPKRMRAVLVLRYWEDLSEADTAQLLGCSVGSVKSQASRGLARLREMIPVGVAE